MYIVDDVPIFYSSQFAETRIGLPGVNVLCLPESMFGPGQEACLRFAFANIDAEQIPQLVDRLLKSQQVT